MIRLRHRTWFKHSVLFAMAALLWLQFALAGHAQCLVLPESTAAVASVGSDAHCDHDASSQALCEAHCGESEASTDSGRIPPVPPLFASVWYSWLAVTDTGNGARQAFSSRVNSPPRPAWNRPTAHPAALLLI